MPKKTTTTTTKTTPTKTLRPLVSGARRLARVTIDCADWHDLTADTRRRLCVPFAVTPGRYFRLRWAMVENQARIGVGVVTGTAHQKEVLDVLGAARVAFEQHELQRSFCRIGGNLWNDPTGRCDRAAIEVQGVPVLMEDDGRWRKLDLMPGLWPAWAPTWLCLALPTIDGLPEEATLGGRYEIQTAPRPETGWRPRSWEYLGAKADVNAATEVFEREAAAREISGEGGWVRLHDRGTNVVLCEAGYARDPKLIRITYPPRRRGMHGRREAVTITVMPT